MTTLEPLLGARLKATFHSLGEHGATHRQPGPWSLPSRLISQLDRHPSTPSQLTVGFDIAKLFTTAAVEIWQRGIHSFLISAALTDASPVWASVSGYYASHYCVRGIAHLLGYLSLYRRKVTVRLEKKGEKYVCSISKGREREHLFYWLAVKKDASFAQDPLFTENPEDVEISDAAHRNYTNYADHLYSLPRFRVLDQRAMQDRVQFISQIPFTDPPIPSRDRWPDLESVQVVAYHRIVAFRRVVDDLLGGGNRFWTVHRTPSWTLGMIDFQLTEQAGLRSDRLRQGLST